MEFLVFEEILDALEEKKEFLISETYYDFTQEELKKRGLEAEFTPIFHGFRVTIF